MIDPNDQCIKSFNHIKKRGQKTDEEYNTQNFEIAIKKFTNINLKIKWPNDIIYENKKISGILIETKKNNAKYTKTGKST